MMNKLITKMRKHNIIVAVILVGIVSFMAGILCENYRLHDLNRTLSTPLEVKTPLSNQTKIEQQMERTLHPMRIWQAGEGQTTKSYLYVIEDRHKNMYFAAYYKSDKRGAKGTLYIDKMSHFKQDCQGDFGWQIQSSFNKSVNKEYNDLHIFHQ